jgi:A118 family predicted phage portal protein
MPLPANNTAWPPPHYHPMLTKFAEHASWYANDIDALTAQYTGEAATDGVVKRAAKAAVRYFWGEKRTDLTKPAERKLHVPVASDLAQASADLLFSEPPTVAVEPVSVRTEDGQDLTDTVTQERLNAICDERFHQTLASAAETAAALGGVFLRATWDESVIADRPFVTKIDYDAAIPEFRFGVLTAVTFWQVVKTNGTSVYRHLERHETDAFGIGVIFHGLYQGTKDNLGSIVPLTEHESTRDLQVDAESKISTLTPGLDVFHMPNVAPNRRWRSDPVGKNLGRSDFDGIEPTLDALDEAYTSLMRDIRLGKAMLVVPEGMLQNNGPGRGTSFEQSEIYSPINAAPGTVADQKLAVEQVQFAIRIEEHERTISLLWNTIIRSAGYSAQTFGEGGDVAITATEVFAKERRSGMSRNRKIRSAQQAVVGLVEKLLAIDAAVFNSGADTSLPVDVVFADGVQDDPEALARTAQLLAASLSASIETRVRLVNPGNDEPWIKAEVERIKRENQLPEFEDPDTLGIDGNGLSDAFTDGGAE